MQGNSLPCIFEEDQIHEEKALHGRPDRLCAAASGIQHGRVGNHSQEGSFGADVLRWRKKYAGLGVAEVCRLKQLEEKNKKLKQLVADLSLDKRMLQDAVEV